MSTGRGYYVQLLRNSLIENILLLLSYVIGYPLLLSTKGKDFTISSLQYTFTYYISNLIVVYCFFVIVYRGKSRKNIQDVDLMAAHIPCIDIDIDRIFHIKNTNNIQVLTSLNMFLNLIIEV